MPKIRSQYVCFQCGAEAPQYFGKCPFCGSWNSMVEQAVTSGSSSARSNVLSATRSPKSSTARSSPGQAEDAAVQPLASLTLPQISDYPQERLSSGYGELER
ncbi:MAG TPA: DNA repair protein RadA, partial [Elainellaceae cyanobacterium]